MSHDPTTKSALVADAAARARAYLRTPGPVFPDEAAIAALDEFTTVLPDRPTEPARVLDQLDRIGSPATVRNTAGRYFGFVTGGTEPEALAASILVSTWDQNIALPVMSPVAARIDDITSRWIVELLGLPPLSLGGFCGGAAVANLTCVLAARDALLARAGWDVDADGLVGAPPLHVVASEEIHVAVQKALRAAGLGRADTVWVPTDECGRVRVELNVAYDSAIAICARGEDLRRAMAIDAAYLPDDAGRASMHLGLQMSQRARAIETWAVIATKGRAGIAEMIAGSCRLAATMADRLDSSGAVILAPVVLNQVLVTFGDDETTTEVIAEVQRDGTCWVGGTTWKGRVAMRISVSDTSATEADAEAAIDAIIRCWSSCLDRRDPR